MTLNVPRCIRKPRNRNVGLRRARHVEVWLYVGSGAWPHGGVGAAVSGGKRRHQGQWPPSFFRLSQNTERGSMHASPTTPRKTLPYTRWTKTVQHAEGSHCHHCVVNELTTLSLCEGARVTHQIACIVQEIGACDHT
jgi:hypothetical protein